MIRLASNLLFSRSQRVLVTDLCWPPYLEWLKRAGAVRGREVHVVNLNDMVCSDKATSNDVVDYLKDGVSAYWLQRIVPVGYQLSGSSAARRRIALAQIDADFTVVDGAQAIHHRRVDLSKNCHATFISPVRKNGSMPISPYGQSIVAQERHASAIFRAVQSLRMDYGTDALFQFCEQLQSAELPPFGTTANVVPLICAAGALAQAHEEKQSSHDFLEIPRTNARAFADWTGDTYWRASQLDQSLSSGIVRLFPRKRLSQNSGSRIRQLLYRHGVVATSYEDGSLRFSMPTKYLSLQQLTGVRRALIHASAAVSTAH